MFQTNVAEKIKSTHFMVNNSFENRAVYGIRWKIMHSRTGHRLQ